MRGTLVDTLGIQEVGAGARRVVVEIESKTNFFAAGRGGTVRAEALPLHAGQRTSCWQTRVTDTGGRLLAQTIQTRMALK